MNIEYERKWSGYLPKWAEAVDERILDEDYPLRDTSFLDRHRINPEVLAAKLDQATTYNPTGTIFNPPSPSRMHMETEVSENQFTPERRNQLISDLAFRIRQQSGGPSNEAQYAESIRLATERVDAELKKQSDQVEEQSVSEETEVDATLM